MKDLFLHSIRTFAVLLLAATTQASPQRPAMALNVRDLSIAKQCQPIVYGNKRTPKGTVCASVTGNNLKIVYDTEDYIINDVHALVSTSEPNANTVAAPGQMPYQNGNGYCSISGSTATCSIPVQDSWRICGGYLYLITHVAYTGPLGQSETGWGNGNCYEAKTSGNCAKYWKIQMSCQCPYVVDYNPISYTVSQRSLAMMFQTAY
jgi:hypothetical protein